MSNSIEEKVIKIITEVMGFKPGDVKASSTKSDLGMDSLDDVECVMAIEEEFDVELPDSAISELYMVSDIANFVMEKIKEGVE